MIFNVHIDFGASALEDYSLYGRAPALRPDILIEFIKIDGRSHAGQLISASMRRDCVRSNNRFEGQAAKVRTRGNALASEFLSSAAALAAALAPSGRLRAAINLGNPVLAQRSGDTLTGVTVDLATALAKQLGVPVELLPYPSGGAVVRALGEDNWDVGFLAAEPERAEAINFTTPYVFIEGTYLVDSASPASSARDLDKVGARIAVGDGAAYHHILARQLQHAELCLAPTSAGAIDLFLTDRLDAAAGVRQTLKAASAQFAGTRVLEDSFSRIEQAIAVPKAKPSGTFEYVQSFLDARVQEGFVERALHRSGQGSASSATHGAGQS